MKLRDLTLPSFESGKFGFFIVAIMCWQMTGANIAAADSVSEATLKQQLRVLAARVEYFENRLKGLEKAEGERIAKSKAKPTSQTKTTDATPSTTSGEQPTAEKSDGLTKKKDDQDFEATLPSLFRDQSPTLKKGKWEISQDVNYSRGEGFLQHDRLVMAVTSAKLGLTDKLEASVAVPFYRSLRNTQGIGGDSNQQQVASFADINAGLSYGLLSQTPSHPGVSVSVAGIIPVGKNPYTWGGGLGGDYQPGGNPIDLFKSVQSKSQYGVRGNFVAYQIVSPLILFAGGGLEYYFARDFGDHTVNDSVRYLFNAGFSFALSDKLTLGTAFQGVYSPDFHVDGVPVPQSFQEQYYLRTSLSWALADNYFLEPYLTKGLTKDSSDFTAGFAVRYRSD